jgi:hypothetical protein
LKFIFKPIINIYEVFNNKETFEFMVFDKANRLQLTSSVNATNFEGSHIIRKFIGIILPIIYKSFSSKGCEQIVELIGLHVSNDQYYCEVLLICLKRKLSLI